MSSILKDYKDLCIKPQWSWLKEVWKGYTMFWILTVIVEVCILYRNVIHDFIMDHLRVLKKNKESLKQRLFSFRNFYKSYYGERGVCTLS